MALWEPVHGVFTASPSWLPAMDFWDKFDWFPFIMTAAAAFITALVGAKVGASAAQKIAKKAKRIDELTAEIRAVNTGITIGMAILNAALSSKSQYIKPVKVRYEAEREKFQAAVKAGTGEAVLVIDRLKFLHVSMPTGDLQQLVMHKISSSGLALRAALALMDSDTRLGEAINHRNNLLDRFSKEDLPPGFSLADLYFGTAVAGGHNKEYRSTLDAVCSYNDEVIFFSLKLCKDLEAHGQVLVKEIKQLSDEPVGIITVNEEAAYRTGLVPSTREFESWLGGYKEVHAPRPPRKWWHWRRKKGHS